MRSNNIPESKVRATAAASFALSEQDIERLVFWVVPTLASWQSIAKECRLTASKELQLCDKSHAAVRRLDSLLSSGALEVIQARAMGIAIRKAGTDGNQAVDQLRAINSDMRRVAEALTTFRSFCETALCDVKNSAHEIEKQYNASKPATRFLITVGGYYWKRHLVGKVTKKHFFKFIFGLTGEQHLSDDTLNSRLYRKARRARNRTNDTSVIPLPPRRFETEAEWREGFVRELVDLGFDRESADEIDGALNSSRIDLATDPSDAAQVLWNEALRETGGA